MHEHQHKSTNTQGRGCGATGIDKMPVTPPHAIPPIAETFAPEDIHQRGKDLAKMAYQIWVL